MNIADGQKPNTEELAERPDNLIAGRQAVREALAAGAVPDTVLVARGKRDGMLNELAAKCRVAGAVVKEVDEHKLSSLADNHQGIAAFLCTAPYATLAQALALAEQRGEEPLLVICDGLQDPHNLGAVIRSAEAAGAHGVIIPERRAVSLTAAAVKASAGAAMHLPVVRVTNITETIKQLKTNRFWVFGLDMDGQTWCDTDLTGPAALVVGAEGDGISRLVRDQCDVLVALPMTGQISSLNASVAAGILLFEALRQRRGLPTKTGKAGK